MPAEALPAGGTAVLPRSGEMTPTGNSSGPSARRSGTDGSSSAARELELLERGLAQRHQLGVRDPVAR